MNKYNLKPTRGKALSEASLKQYTSGLDCVANIIKACDITINEDDEFILNPSKLCSYGLNKLNKDMSIYINPKNKKPLSQGRKKDLFKALKAYSNSWDDDDDTTGFKKELSSIQDKAYATYFKTIEDNKGVKTDRDKKNWVDWDELITIRENLKFSVKALMIKDKKTLSSADYQILQKYTLASVYTYIPPRRNIFRTLTYIHKKAFNKIHKPKQNIYPKENYLVITPDWKQAFFYLGDQKSSGHKRIIQIPKQLKKIIKLNAKHSQGNYLFTHNNKRTSPVSSNTFTKQLNATFKIHARPQANIGCVSVRKAYDSRADIQEVLLKAHEIADDMGHSVSTAATYYSK
tara:strand:- start:1563 stop:2600 length:1038 start_codon:yes stop_codon:yes gene_type:complete